MALPARSEPRGAGAKGRAAPDAPRSDRCFSLEPAVSRVLFRRFRRWWSFLWAARCRAARATNSGFAVSSAARVTPAGCPAIPYRSCSGWGLPCPPRHRGRGALLPHRFTRARHLAAPGGLFSVALSFESPRLAVSQHPALRSPDFPRRARGPPRPPVRLEREARELYRAQRLRGGARALLVRPRRGRVWEPSQGSHPYVAPEAPAAWSSFMISSQ